jgi:hypothetical protein
LVSFNEKFDYKGLDLVKKTLITVRN